MKISRRALINITLGVVLVAVVVASLILFLPKGTSATAAATQLTTTVKQGAVSTTITASGSIEPYKTVSESFSESGTIATVKVKVGQTVKKGAVLGTIETADYTEALSDANDTLSDAYSAVSDANSAISTGRSDLVAANAAVAAAKKDAASNDPQTASAGEQALSSAQQQVTQAESEISQGEDQLDSANDQVKQALSTVNDAQDAVDATTLRATATGLVTAVSGEVGSSTGSSSGGSSTTTGSTDTTTTSSGFVTIAVVSKMTMTANIAEADIADVKVGQAVDISFPALTDVTTTAKVTAIAPTATSSNSVVTYATTITLTKIPTGLRLGQTADATITTETSDADALYVPTAAVTTASDGTSSVKVVADDGTTTTTTVETGVVGDDGTEITSGLAAGDTVVLGTVSADTGTDTGTTGNTRTGTGGFGGTGGTGGFPGGGTGGTGGFPGGGN